MTAPNDKLHGTYKINSQDFPVPITVWTEQPVASGLNGIPINSNYKRHTWQFSQLESQYAEYLYSLFASQQTGNAQLSSLETDPFDATGANKGYGTSEYTDFVILEVGSRTRGLPMYDDVSVEMEVFVA